MKKGNIVFSTLFTIVISSLIVFASFSYAENTKPIEVYNVYLDGEKIGIIASKTKLYEMIDKEQNAIKEKYNEDKVYPPNNLKVVKNITYDSKVEDELTIYNRIKDISDFTIKGYRTIIKSHVEEKEDIIFSTLSESVIEESILNYVKAIIGSEEYEAFMNNTQGEITDIGQIIEAIKFEETITIKEDFIGSEETVFLDSQELTHFLLFGKDYDNEKYVVKAGDSISDIAFNNKLNIEELLITNPDIKGESALLYIGQEINVTLINPQLTLSYDVHEVYDEETAFKTEIKYDNSKVSGYSEVIQKGEPGITRITKKTTYVNGEENQGGYIASYQEIKPAINKVVVRGSKFVGSVEFIGNDTWAWPTISPFYISSGFGYRWGRMHYAIDIAGCGSGSPIYAANGGVVVKNTFDSSHGNYIVIDHQNGYFTMYAHLSKSMVSEGTVVSYNQRIGSMGSTGNSTGVHLHFGLWIGGVPYSNGAYSIDPRTLYK